MKLRIKVKRSKVQSNLVNVMACAGDHVPKKVTPFTSQHSGRTIDTVWFPEFDYCIQVNLPRNLKDYERYRKQVREATTKVKAFVVNKYIRKYPLGAC